MLRCMATWRVVAATHLAALEADPQVEPRASLFEAFLAPLDGFGKLKDLNAIYVSAASHRCG